MNDFVTTTAAKKLSKLSKRIKIVQGGTSAGKTFNILPILQSKAISKPNQVISVVAESIPHLKRGALKDFLQILHSTNRYNDEQFLKGDRIYKFHNGSYIEFFSADQPDRLRGARRDILYINEANNIPFESYQQLAIRTDSEVWLDFNPTHEFWAHTELKEDPDSEFIILTYKDNEALSDSIIKEIEKARDKAKTSEYWSNWWNVYGLGKIGSLEGVVFQNWKQIDKIPNDAQLLAYGLDFGYSNDPTAVIAVYKYDQKILLDEIIYQKGMLNSDIANRLKPITGLSMIYADSAEPKSIKEIRLHGLNIKATDKGRDSVNYGINLLQQYDLRVTKRSTNLIKELRHYTWDTTKTGEKLNKPIDAFNHAIDAVRYVAMMKLNTNRGIYDVRF